MKYFYDIICELITMLGQGMNTVFLIRYAHDFVVHYFDMVISAFLIK